MPAWLSHMHLILMLVIIVLDVISLVEHYGNIIGAYLPNWTSKIVPLILLVPLFYLFRKVHFSHNNTGQPTYRPLWRHSVTILLALALLAAILVIAFPRTDVSSKFPIVIADMEDHTTNQVFSGLGADTLLTMALKQSPSIDVFPQKQIEEALQRMKKEAGTKITKDVAQEICTREGIGPFVAWSVAEEDEKYSMEARILDPQDGRTLKQVKVGPFVRESIIESIGELAKKLQKSFGDSSLQIFISTKPLKPATTASLPALQAYSEGLEALKRFDYKTGEEKLLRALELDPDFALAMVELASVYEYKGESASSIGHLKRAFEHLEHLTEPERVRVKEAYYWYVENDHAKAFEEINEFLKRFPRNQERIPTLVYSNFAVMRFDVAEELSQRLLSQKPWTESQAEDAFALWQIQLARDEFQQALNTADQIEQDIPKLPDHPYLRNILRVALGETSAENEISKLRKGENTEAGLWLNGFMNLYRGKLQTTLADWTQYVPLIEKEGRVGLPWIDSESMGYLWLGRVATLTGNAKEAKRNLEHVKEGATELLAEAGKYYARIGELNQAQEILDRLRSRLAERQTNQNRLLLLLLESEIELKKGNSQKSLALILQGPDYQWSALYWQRQESKAYITFATGQFDETIKTCKEMIGRKGFAFSLNRPDDWIMAHYYLARSYDSRNMKELALNAYEGFERLWHHGDPEIPSLKLARRRIAELRR